MLCIWHILEQLPYAVNNLWINKALMYNNTLATQSSMEDYSIHHEN